MPSWYSGVSVDGEIQEEQKGGGVRKGSQEKGKRTSEIKQAIKTKSLEREMHAHTVGGRQDDVAITPKQIDRHTTRKNIGVKVGCLVVLCTSSPGCKMFHIYIPFFTLKGEETNKRFRKHGTYHFFT